MIDAEIKNEGLQLTCSIKKLVSYRNQLVSQRNYIDSEICFTNKLLAIYQTKEKEEAEKSKANAG